MWCLASIVIQYSENLEYGARFDSYLGSQRTNSFMCVIAIPGILLRAIVVVPHI